MEWLFEKLHGLGNDYLYFDVRSGEDEANNWPDLARHICDRHFGVGADGIILIGHSERADARMTIYNADGSRSEMCGNGLRALAKWLYDRGLAGVEQVIETDAGLLYPQVVELQGDKAYRIRVNMGPPRFAAKDSGLVGGGDHPFLNEEVSLENEGVFQACLVSMGNPHLIIFGSRWDEATMARLGAKLEHHPRFPSRINVHSVEVVDRHRLAVRHWERGAGLTLACGTGAAACAAAAIRLDLAVSPVSLAVPGGVLQVEWSEGDSPVYLTGPAQEVFSGRYLWPSLF